MERVILPLVEEQDQMGERDLFYSFFVLGRFKSDRSRWLDCTQVAGSDFFPRHVVFIG